MAKTTTDLINNVKRRTQLPDDGGTLSDSDILALATDEIQNVVFPRLMAMHEWHSAYSYTQTITSTRTYRINPRTAGNSIISVEYYDGNNYRFIRLKHPLLQRQDLGENYAIYGNQIVLSDAVPTSGSIRVRALLRPSALVNSGCTSLTAAATAANIAVTSSTGFTSGMAVDLQYDTSPYEIAEQLYTTAVPDATHVTLSAVPADTTIGTQTTTSGIGNPGRLCPAEQTDRVPLADELHDYLAQKVAIRLMEARGFTGDMNNHLRKLQDLEVSFDRLISPRSKGEYKAIVSEDWLFIGRV